MYARACTVTIEQPMNLLQSDKWPYALTLLIGVFAWHINLLISHELDAPVLTLKRSSGNITPINDSTLTDETVFELSNLSDKIVFRNLHIICMYRSSKEDGTPIPEPRKLLFPLLVAVAPSALVDSLPLPLGNDEGVEFTLPVMQPGNTYQLRFQTRRNKAIHEYPLLYLDSSQPVGFRLSGLHAWMLENFFPLNIGLLIFWMVLIGIYIVRSLKPAKQHEKS